MELRVAASDLGKVIGKQGRTARSIRTLLGAAGHEAEPPVHAGNSGIALKLVTIARLLARARQQRGACRHPAHRTSLDRLKSVFVNQAPMEVERTWMHGDQLIFKFKGVDTISDAERLAGAEVSIPIEQRAAAPGGRSTINPT